IHSQFLFPVASLKSEAVCPIHAEPTQSGSSVWDVGRIVGQPVLMYPFAITRIGVMANGVQPMKLGLAKELDQIEEAVSSGPHPEDPDIIS
ncbi:MAG: hypothetical protein ACXWOV_12315, partial [Isosphaeraceae bacterium]